MQVGKLISRGSLDFSRRLKTTRHSMLDSLAVGTHVWSPMAKIDLGFGRVLTDESATDCASTVDVYCVLDVEFLGSRSDTRQRCQRR